MKTESPALAEPKETRREEKKSRDRPWIFFLVFCCSSSMFVYWLRFHRCMFGASPFSDPTPKRGPQLATVFTLSWLVFTCVFTLSCLRAKWRSNPCRPFISAGCPRKNISVSGGSSPAQRIWDLPFFFFFFSHFRSHSPVTGWPTTNALAWLTRDQLAVQ